MNILIIRMDEQTSVNHDNYSIQHAHCTADSHYDDNRKQKFFEKNEEKLDISRLLRSLLSSFSKGLGFALIRVYCTRFPFTDLYMQIN